MDQKSSGSVVKKRKVILDTDCGSDDALAIVLLLRDPNIELLAITTVFGNVSLRQATENVGIILSLFKGNNIPYYAGASHSILETKTPEGWEGHGKNGLGDAIFPEVNPRVEPQKEHAALALIRLISSNPGEVNIICLGPLTNLALAMRLDTQIPSKIASITMMGGSSSAKGNASVAAEFNIHCDPEACHIVLSTVPPTLSPILVTWDLCENAAIPWSGFDELTSTASPAEADLEARFLKMTNSLYEKLVKGKYWPAAVAPHIHEVVQTKKQIQKADAPSDWADLYNVESQCHANPFLFCPCDVYAVAVFLHPELVLKQQKIPCFVELSGRFGRGGLYFDWYGNISKQDNSIVIHEIDRSMFFELLQIRFGRNHPNKFLPFRLTKSAPTTAK